MTVFQLLLAPDGAVTGYISSNLEQEGGVTVDVATFNAVVASAGAPVKLVAGALVSYEPAPRPPAVPATISDRQFFQALAIQGRISQDEALDAVRTGTLPAALLTAVAALPTDQQFGAKMLLTGATTFDRAHPMAPLLSTALEVSPAELDDIFRLAGTL